MLAWMDSEFVDDTTLYVQASHVNLMQVQKVVDDFSHASGALINWDKSSGFWVAEGDPPNNVFSSGFTWIHTCHSIRYLGCRVGLGLNAEKYDSALFVKIKE